MALSPSTLVLQRTRVRLLLQEPTAQYWTDAVIDNYINEAQLAIACGLIPGTPVGMEEPLLGSEAYTDSVTDQELYSLPPNYHGVRTVRVRSSASDNYSEISSTDIEYVRAHPRTSSPKPEAYFLWGESGTYQIGMYPAFSTTSSSSPRLYVSYWRKPDNLASNPDALLIPAELHVCNTYLAAHKAWLERGYDQDADKMLKLFNLEYQANLAYIRRRQINQNRAVMLGTIGDDNTERQLR